ncbi:Hypothetical protein CINCED_3A008031 [Cinara cedri]|uniref:Uncharacterized protein n=1 Tax=Cinara cedri TaxID=506608 RepID=A0A5E4MB49_9HEMI|nr:Hypothetical protein CINCED_3A008031 [Cinara cedri]
METRNENTLNTEDADSGSSRSPRAERPDIGEQYQEFKKNKDIQEYFQKPIETGERLLNVLKFQKSHTSKLIKHHQLIITKYNRTKLYIKKLESELKNAKRALKNTPQNHNFTESCSSSVLEFDATPFKMIHAGVEEQNTRQVAKCNFCGRS